MNRLGVVTYLKSQLHGRCRQESEAYLGKKLQTISVK
jgi:hypothetical protein